MRYVYQFIVSDQTNAVPKVEFEATCVCVCVCVCACDLMR